MTREESTKIVDKIKLYRQSFMITNSLYVEWFRILEPYDYKDVDKKLDEYFKDSDNFGRYPDVYYLTRYLRTIEEKKNAPSYTPICPHCRKEVTMDKFQKHYDRCSSVLYLREKSTKHFSKQLSYKKLMEASEKEFDEFYLKFCRELYDVLPNGLEKHLLENVILTGEGKEPKLGFEEIITESGFGDEAW